MPLSQESNSNKPQEIVAIDLGSNSFHMIVARIVNGALQILSRVKQRVHLADGLDEDKYLSTEAIERGLVCLALFAERLQGFSPDQVRLVGTHTLREAQNADDFVKKATDIIPYPIEIISGQEEARLIYMGVTHTQPEKGQKLVIDIGGGSTELVIGNDFDTLIMESRPMGCVSYQKKFFPNGELSKSLFQKAKLAAMQQLENIAWQFRLYGWQHTLGASGTIKATYHILAELDEDNNVITPKTLQKLIDLILKNKNVANLKLEGLSEDRRDVFVPGLAILSAIFDSLHLQSLALSDGALREGVLYEMEDRFRHKDIRSRTAMSLAEHYNIDRDQAHRVLQSTQHLYNQWAQQNPKLVEPQLETLLGWSALLHEVGLSINHHALQKHSSYILQHTNLPGFNQEHQLLLATFVRFQRKSIRLDELPKFLLFKKKQYLPMIQLLRLSVLLNNQRQATTKPSTLRLITKGAQWLLIFPKSFLTQNSLLLTDLEQESEYWKNGTDWELALTEEQDP